MSRRTRAALVGVWLAFLATAAGSVVGWVGLVVQPAPRVPVWVATAAAVAWLVSCYVTACAVDAVLRPGGDELPPHDRLRRGDGRSLLDTVFEVAGSK